MHTAMLSQQERNALVALLKTFARDPEPVASPEKMQAMIETIENIGKLDSIDAGSIAMMIDYVVFNLKKKLKVQTDFKLIKENVEFVQRMFQSEETTDER